MAPEPPLSSEKIRRLQNRLEKDFVESQALASFSSRIQKNPILGRVLDDVYEIFKGVIPFDRLSLCLLDEDETIARVIWARSDFGPTFLKPGYKASIVNSSLQKVLDDNEPRIINDLKAYAEKNGPSDSTRLILKEGILSNLTCPLYAGGKSLGFLFFASREKGTYDKVHVDTFVQIASELSVLLEKSRLYNEIVELRRFKYQFMGLAAHDLNSPLQICHKLTRLLLSGAAGALNQTQNDALARMSDEQVQMLELLKELLELSEVEIGELVLEKRGVDLRNFLEEFVKSHQIFARSKNITLEFRPEGQLPFIQIDPARLTQALDNLVSNAVKYSYEKSAVLVESSCSEKEAVIRVIDAGKGIPAADLSRLFKEFGRAHVDPIHGERTAGLGLVVVKKIVDAHGGRIEVESEEERGSTFSIFLPIRAPKK